MQLDHPLHPFPSPVVFATGLWQSVRGGRVSEVDITQLFFPLDKVTG